MDTALSSLALPPLGETGLGLAFTRVGEPTRVDGLACVSIRSPGLGL